MDPELAETLKRRTPELTKRRAVLLPDLFIDHMVPVAGIDALKAEFDRLVAQGGGNTLQSGQHLRLGGNAANTAYAMARLGVQVTLVALTDTVGATLWRLSTKGLPATDQGIIEGVQASSTVALELSEQNANLMLSDPGPLGSLHPDDLGSDTWRWIEQADVVAVMNWSQTLTHGTALAARVVEHAKKGGTFSYMDTGDPAHRGDDARALVEDQNVMRGLGAWGLNENETRFFAGLLKGVPPGDLDLEDAAHTLARHTGSRIDVHTHSYALSIEHARITRVPSVDVTPRLRTGAGDAWNAGNLTGTLLSLEPRERLLFANAVAAAKLGDPDGAPPTMADLLEPQK